MSRRRGSATPPDNSMITTRRRLQYVAGYLELGMLAEAARELDAIPPHEQGDAEVLAVRVDLHMGAKQWDAVISLAAELARLKPTDSKGWVCHAYALREQDRIEEAQAVLREAEPLHGQECGVLHYNLACYACLLGDRKEAKRRLKIALKMDATWKKSALDDPDLRTMQAEIEELK